VRVPRILCVILITASVVLPLAAQNPVRPPADTARRDSSRVLRPDSSRTDSARAPSDTVAGRGLSGAVAAVLRPRLIGPAMISGRIVSVAVDPRNPAVIYAAAASGGVWKTESAGATWTPIFDRQGSYSIGTITLDPKIPSTVWVGTGENNSQRSVGYGDGVYRSDDAGRTWHRMGLERSEHIGRIVVDPRNSDIVYVAAQGPLWSDGGDRGLYKSTDGGKSWSAVLSINERTGVTDVVLDPRNPDLVIAATYQRRRHVWTLIDGGPESGLQRSMDGGRTWRKITTGIPSGQLGRIGLAISPANPDIIYATIEAEAATGGRGGGAVAAEGAAAGGGIFRSTDGGLTWERRSSYAAQPMYYATLVADPFNAERVYSMDVNTQVSDDGGSTWRALGERSKHGDNHALWIDPRNPDHYLNGNDGGLYQSWDAGKTWIFFANLPLGQFYDVDVDYATPFFHVCGGTQDNSSVCGPSATRNNNGILNSDWFVTTGGDGFVSRIDPQDPNTIYAESQNGGMVRYDTRTGEEVSMQPQEARGEDPSRWNWDTPILISPHSHTRVYTASQRLYRSDDRGDSWTAVSGDLTRKLDRNALPVMGKVWGPDAVAKNQSTAFYSNVSAIAESFKQEGLLYVGTDDGLLQISDDGGAQWRKIESITGVPANTYVQRIIASPSDAKTVFVAFDNHQNGDFSPYLFKSTDAGQTWTSIAGDLPKRGGVYAIEQDHADPRLLFCGTEFGGYVSNDGGVHWIKIPGLPTIMVRDIAIQRRTNSLALGTFGRGIYVVDDYSVLRHVTPDAFNQTIAVFPISDAVSLIRRGSAGKGNQGEALYAAANPPNGTAITYSLKETMFQTLRDKRLQAQRDAERQSKPIRYPTPDDFVAEAEEEPIVLAASIADERGAIWRVLNLPATRGVHSVTWDLRGSTETPADPSPGAAVGGGRGGGGGGGGGGPAPSTCVGCVAVPPGKYTMTVGKREHGVFSALATPVTFAVLPDSTMPITLAGRQANLEYRRKQAALSRQITEAVDAAGLARTKADAIIRVLNEMPSAPRTLHDQARSIDQRLAAFLRAVRGDDVNAARGEQVPVSIQAHIRNASPSGSTSPPSKTEVEQYDIAVAAFPAEYAKLKPILVTEIPALDKELEKLGAPPTPGRIPDIGP
jgi:photosystem II stability/assembly factor-like uncharacterized protein